MGWYGVDLDSTLAVHNPGDGIDKIGEPVPKTLAWVKSMVANGEDVRIFTARMSVKNTIWVEKAIAEWTLKHVGKALPATCRKDFDMISLRDDRAVGVVPNEGTTHLELLEAAHDKRRK